MNREAYELYVKLSNSNIGEKIVNKLKDEKGQIQIIKKKEQDKFIIDEEIFECYVYVLLAEAPSELEKIRTLYSIISDISEMNYSKWQEIYNNYEAFLKKILYLTYRNKYEEYKIEKESSEVKKGIKRLSSDKYLNLKAPASDPDLYKRVRDWRNEIHDAYKLKTEVLEDRIVAALCAELCAVSQYKGKLQNNRMKYNSDEYKELVVKYLEEQINNYNEKQQSEDYDTYIQIEYEKAEDVTVKGIADNIMETIDFEQYTPHAVKLVAEAGMGKTMMLEYLSSKLSQDMRSFIEENKENNFDSYKKYTEKVIPVLIYCNDCTKNPDLVEYDFHETIKKKLRLFLDSQNKPDIPEEDFLKDLKNKYNLIFLLDGFNEINQNLNCKSKFIKSLVECWGKRYQDCYFFITERYSRTTPTIQNITTYNLSELTKNFKMAFFANKDGKTLFARIEKIFGKYNPEEQEEFMKLLNRPFYLSVFCKLVDSLETAEVSKLPKGKMELMDLFVEKLIEREQNKGDTAAVYPFVRFYLKELAVKISSTDNTAKTEEVNTVFEEVKSKYGLDDEVYKTIHMISLFEQLGFISFAGNNKIVVKDIYADFIADLYCE